MDKEAKDMNRALADPDARDRLSCRYLTSLQISTTCLALIIVLSNVLIILQNKRAVNNQQIFWIASSLAILPYALYCIAQLKVITITTKGSKKKCEP